jgi:hypothetical protein
VKLAHRHLRDADQTSQLDPALGVEKVYFVDEPLWYLRLTSRLRLSWRRELATVASVFGLGLALGFLLGRL